MKILIADALVQSLETKLRNIGYNVLFAQNIEGYLKIMLDFKSIPIIFHIDL